MLDSKLFKNTKFLSIIAGILYGLSYAPINSILCAFISIAIFYFISNDTKSRSGTVISTLIFGTISYIISLHWIVNSLLIDVKQWWFLIPPTLILIPFVLSLYYLIISIPFFYIKNKTQNTAVLSIIFSLLWTLAEIAKGYLFTGFPWNLLGTIWIDYHHIAQIIHYTNIYFLGFITVLFVTLLSNILFKRKQKKINLFVFTTLVIGLLLFIEYGKNNNHEVKTINTIKIRMIQPNIKQKFKWQQEEQENVFFKILKLSFRKGFQNDENDKPDLIIWPETAFPFVINIDKLKDYQYLQFTLDHLDKNQLLLIGAIRVTNANEDIFNSVMVFQNNPDKQLIDFYDKRHLVPFGEFVPFYKTLQNLLHLQILDDLSNVFSNLSFGNPDKATIKLKDDLIIMPLVCYEGIFPFNIQNNKDIKFIVNLTNDAWFGKSFGPYQHLRAVQAQVIKSGLTLIRVANSGISIVIDSQGKVLKQLELETEGVLDFVLDY